MKKILIRKKVLEPLIFSIFILALVFLPKPNQAQAATYQVSPGQSIQTAIDNASNGDTIELLAGTHTVNAEIEINGKDLTILGDDAQGATVVQGDGGCRIFSIADSTCTLENLTVTNGYVNGDDGAGILQDGGVLTLKNCVVTQNGSVDTDYGGGVAVFGGELEVTGCTIEKNAALGGGGIYGEDSTLKIPSSTIQENTCDGVSGYLGGGVMTVYSDLIISDSTIKNNSAPNGGGLGVDTTFLEITNTIIASNFSNYDGGGGLYLYYSQAAVSSSNISNNSATIEDEAYGGGFLVVIGSLLAIEDCVISGNQASYDGGGMYLVSSKVTMYSSSVSNNRSGSGGDTWGGGINISSGSDMTISNSTISGNSAGSGGGIWLDSFNWDFPLSTRLYSLSAPSIGAAGFAGNLDAIWPFSGETSLTMTNSTVSGNRAVDDGGGLNLSGTATINFCTVTDNTADKGGGVRSDYFSSVNLGNSIVAGNTSTSQGPDWHERSHTTSEGGNLIGDNSDSDFTQGSPNSDGDYVGDSASPIDPLLDDLADNGGTTLTHALLSDLSPAVDHAATCVNKDQRGYDRPYPKGGACDIGAFEYYGDTDLSLTKTVDNSTPVVGNQISYTLTVTNNGPDQGVGVSVTDKLPEGVTYVSDDSEGSYDVNTGIWTVGAMDVSSSSRLQITVSVDQSGTITNTATAESAKTDPRPASASVDIQAQNPSGGGGGGGGSGGGCFIQSLW